MKCLLFIIFGLPFNQFPIFNNNLEFKVSPQDRNNRLLELQLVKRVALIKFFKVGKIFFNLIDNKRAVVHDH